MSAYVQVSDVGSDGALHARKMVENEYLAHERSVRDRRSIHVRLTEKGIKLRDSLTVMHRRHAEMLSRAALSVDDLQAAGVTLRRLERFWVPAADLVQRPQPLAKLPFTGDEVVCLGHDQAARNGSASMKSAAIQIKLDEARRPNIGTRVHFHSVDNGEEIVTP
jgi:hypothetical protein